MVNSNVNAVLKAEEYWRENIIGVAAELLQVEDKYVTALETALGEGAQNIVTLDAQTAKTAINYLKANNAGRATFLPLDTVKPRSLSVEEERLEYDFSTSDQLDEFIELDHGGKEIVTESTCNYAKFYPTDMNNLYSIFFFKQNLKAGMTVEMDRIM